MLVDGKIKTSQGYSMSMSVPVGPGVSGGFGAGITKDATYDVDKNGYIEKKTTVEGRASITLGPVPIATNATREHNDLNGDNVTKFSVGISGDAGVILGIQGGIKLELTYDPNKKK
ncbi:hypothetical protein DCC81_16920 [Chitinophaga parva]|uniref:Uncharacterized protein n=2 Tax=Chitinophaga parva TaxID=2169414 RepID=A0A2T7BI32_9BACT|nr:hypothetical protein DCC81_16920 [Chitinophaga parva]